jgi:pimeloyl-ACP methyl ester carboxylesterase
MPKPRVNKKVFDIPKSILLIGKVLQFISPKLATNYVLRLFMTPFRFPRPKREKIMFENAKSNFLQVPTLKKNIKVFHFGQSRKKVLLVHGWAGRGTQLYKIADALIENGYMTISFDATGHGDSEGKTSAMPEFIASIFEIEKQYGPFDFAIGHSLGGMAVLKAVKEGLKVKSIAILGSGNSITAICYQFVNRLGLKEKVGTFLKDKLDDRLGEDSEVLSAYVSAQSVDIPTLVIHDTNDTDVPVKCATDIHKNLSNGELFITEGLGHRRILINKQVIDKILIFFNII